MNELFEAQLQYLIDNPDRLKLAADKKEDFIRKMKSISDDKTVSVEDIRAIADAADFSFKNLLMKYCLPYVLISEKQICQWIEKEDLEILLFIASMNILKKDGQFYLVTANRFDETKLISEDTIEKLRIFFLKKGRPINARFISSEFSFYKPGSLNDSVCSLKDLQIYMLGANSLKAPVTDWLTRKIFNGLNVEDKEKVLGWIVNAYKQFTEVREIEQGFFVSDEQRILYFIGQTDFNEYETDSPLKEELIVLQKEFRERSLKREY